MARLKDLAEKVADLFMIDPKKLVADKDWNVRIHNDAYEERIQELMASIREIGVLEPLTVYKDEEDLVHITNGFTRHAAIMRLLEEGVEIKAVPCRTEDRGANDADRVLSMLTRNSGLPLTPFEQAQVMKRLIAFGWDVKDIARKVGKTPGYVNQLLDLLAAPAEVQKMVKEGSVSATAAAKTLKKEGPTKGAETLKTAKAAAEASGAKKVTPKAIEKVSPKAASATQDWAKLGPKLYAALEAVRDAAPEKREAALQKALNLVSPMQAAS